MATPSRNQIDQHLSRRPAPVRSESPIPAEVIIGHQRHGSRRKLVITGNAVSPGVTRLPQIKFESGMKWVKQRSSCWTHFNILNAKKREHLKIQVKPSSKGLWTYRIFKGPHHSPLNWFQLVPVRFGSNVPLQKLHRTMVRERIMFPGWCQHVCHAQSVKCLSSSQLKGLLTQE